MPDFSAEQLTQIFRRLDADGSGRIDVYELQKVVQRHLPDHEAAHAAALRLIEQVDENHDGQVDYREFCLGVEGGKFPGMGAAPAAATPAAQPAPAAADIAADQAEFERRQRVAADAEAVEQEELRIKQELERRVRDLEAEASRAAAEATRQERLAASLQAEAQSEHEKVRREEEELKRKQRDLRQVYSAGQVPADIKEPTCLTTAYYEMDRDAELQELRRDMDVARGEIEREQQLVVEADAAAEAQLAEARQLRTNADHAQSDVDAARRQVEREARLLESQHRVVVADETEALQAQRKTATEVFQQLFDTECNGAVSLSVLHHRLSDFGHSEHEIELLCHSLRSTDDGMVTLEHFVQGYPRYHSLMD